MNAFYLLLLVTVVLGHPDDLYRQVLTDDEIRSPEVRRIIQDSLNIAVQQNLFCSEGALQIMKPQYMARVDLGGATQYEFFTRIKSSLGPTDDRPCYASGLYKFVSIDRLDGRGLSVTVTQIFV